MAGFGFKFGPLHSTLPFLLLGIGVDDAFIITSAFHHTYDADAYPMESSIPLHERVALAMSHAGMSITLTSITDALAFGIGASTTIPALSSFCAYASFGILWCYLLQVFFFTACLVVDQWRAQRQIYDFLCCIKASKPHLLGDIQDGQVVDRYCYFCTCKPDLLARFLGGPYANILTKTPVKVGVLAVAAALLGASIYGATNLEERFDLAFFVPDDSYGSKYFDYLDDYYSGAPVPMTVVVKDFDYYANRDTTLPDVSSILRTSKYVEASTVESIFEEYARSPLYDTSTPAAWYTGLSTFITQDGPGKRFEQDIVWRDPLDVTQGIRASRLRAGYRGSAIPDSPSQVDAMLTLRKELADVDGVDVFHYSFEHLTWEASAVIVYELILNLSLAFTAVFLVTLFLIGHPLTSIRTLSSCVSSTVLSSLSVSFMYYWGVPINTVSVIYIVLGLGLSVDYSAHIGYSFMLQQAATRDERVVKALGEIGASVLNGAFSTFLAILVLAFSKSYVFRVFFIQFFDIAVFGVAAGICILPVLLSWLGSAPYTIPQDAPVKDGKVVETLEDTHEPSAVTVPTIRQKSAEENHEREGEESTPPGSV
ncbi:unnamed protein product [Vitrella brassicaformis CCMP3155]|uniref:SSD domain-containing protein n=2 Tax=Vitrella brassicaformis TaxID=1169539 RepID=A0A0G4EFH1_VITBC|nr:unnamed protein product [Vitrella brassicaformis CCMP3155]|eukprot:CEL94251.1 unnamed protein product [Vitrella brassicaformis CCMP3155]